MSGLGVYHGIEIGLGRRAAAATFEHGALFDHQRRRLNVSTKFGRAPKLDALRGHDVTVDGSLNGGHGDFDIRVPTDRNDEMGAVACFLASDDAAYITGQTIFVDGGLTLFPSFREPWSSE